MNKSLFLSLVCQIFELFVVILLPALLSHYPKMEIDFHEIFVFSFAIQPREILSL